jgi:microcystin-dependent protein
VVRAGRDSAKTEQRIIENIKYKIKTNGTKISSIKRLRLKMLTMKKIYSVLIISLLITSVYAQVGFNNPNPDPSSILDLTAVDKGFLVPRLTTPQREAIATPGRSLLVFDSTEGRFYFYDGGQWYALNEWVRAAGSNNVSLNGNATLTGAVNASSLNSSGNVTGVNISASGTVSGANYALNANGNGPVPAGGIIMWSGSLASIPVGWVLCDGTNGTPDLRERFVVGAGGDNATVTVDNGIGGSYAVNDKGGLNGVALSINQIPSHTHTVNDPGHNHGDRWLINFAGGSVGYNGLTGTINYNFNSENKTTGITVSQTPPIGSGGRAHENRPPYYALAFIMKLP